MRRVFLVAALLVLATSVMVAASEHGRLSRRVQQDVLEAMGKSVVEDSSSDSITVVPHNYFAPEGPSSDRSLLHAAESISHHVEDAMEEATYSDYSDLVGRPTQETVQPVYTQEIDPAFLIEQHSDSIERDLSEEEALENVGRQAREYAEETEIGLIEEAAEIDQPAVTVLPAAAAPKTFVVSTNEPTYISVPAPAPVAAPKPQYVTPQYKRRARKPTPPAPAAPVSNVTFVTPLYKEDHPIVVAQRAREQHRAARKAARAARRAARAATEWKVAPVIPSSHILASPKQVAKRAAQFITPALKAKAPKRRCIRRDAKTKKCLQRCRKCTFRRAAPKPAPKQYFSPAFYYGKKPSKKAKRAVVKRDQRVLVQTPNGPVYVLYVSRHRKSASPQTVASGPVALSGPVTSFAQAPRHVVRTRDGATYVLPSPYGVQAQAAAEARRQAWIQAQKNAAAIRSARRAARRTARRQAKIAAAQRLRAQQAANTEYDPKSHTIIRHNHHHHFSRVAAPASIPTLRRAYVKLCRLQKAIVTKYNSSARRAALKAARQAKAAAESAASDSNAVTAAQALNTKYDSNAAEADALRAKYDAHLRRYRRAQKLIKRASAFLKRRKHLRDARRAAIVHCRLRNHKAGRPVPKCGARRRRGSRASRKLSRRRYRAALKRKAKAIRKAKKRCRDLARAAGVNIPDKCQSNRMSQNVFRKRYDPKTNRVRFQSKETPQAEAAKAEEAPVAPAHFQPVDGLDYNQSPLIKKLVAQLKAENIVGV